MNVRELVPYCFCYQTLAHHFQPIFLINIQEKCFFFSSNIFFLSLTTQGQRCPDLVTNLTTKVAPLPKLNQGQRHFVGFPRIVLLMSSTVSIELVSSSARVTSVKTRFENEVKSYCKSWTNLKVVKWG